MGDMSFFFGGTSTWWGKSRCFTTMKNEDIMFPCVTIKLVGSIIPNIPQMFWKGRRSSGAKDIA